MVREGIPEPPQSSTLSLGFYPQQLLDRSLLPYHQLQGKIHQRNILRRTRHPIILQRIGREYYFIPGRGRRHPTQTRYAKSRTPAVGPPRGGSNGRGPGKSRNGPKNKKGKGQTRHGCMKGNRSPRVPTVRFHLYAIGLYAHLLGCRPKGAPLAPWTWHLWWPDCTSSRVHE